MFKSLVSSAVVFGTVALLASASHAAPVVFFGENQSPGGVVSGAPLTARNSFLSNLTGVVSQGFESFGAGVGTPLNLTFTGSGATTLVATLSGAGAVDDTDTTGGRFNTTPSGSKWWEVSGTFDIDFAAGSEISAFGFYGTDIGDFDGQITVLLTKMDGTTTELTVQNTVNGSNASLLFWGFIDTANSYKKIRFGNTNAGTDVFGFDDMVIGDQRQIVNPTPEPASLALAGLALFAAGWARKAQRRT